MAIVSVTEASRLVGKTRKTIQRYISIGKLSKVTGSDDKEGIDTSELIRVFGEISTQSNSGDISAKNTINVAPMTQENVALKKEIELLRELLTAKDAHIESLNKALLIIEHKKEQPPLQESIQQSEQELSTQSNITNQVKPEETSELIKAIDMIEQQPKRKKFLGLF